jgi:hypothetical protein
MSLSRFHRALIGFVLLLLFTSGCGSEPAPIAVPHTATPDFASDDNPTVGAVVRVTRQAQATATQRAVLDEAATRTAVEATQTAEARADATATVIARATAQAIVAEKAEWPLQISESFQDNQLGWPVGVKQDHSLAVTSTIEAGNYRWLVNVVNGNSYFNLVPTNSSTFTNFYAGVNVQFGQGDNDGRLAYGLTFRHVDNDYGFFGITKSGEFLALEVHHTGIYQSIGDHVPTLDTRPGHTNRLEVIGCGSDFVFLINGRQVGMLTAEIDPGQIGLGVDAARHVDTAQVEFTDFEVHAP